MIFRRGQPAATDKEKPDAAPGADDRNRRLFVIGLKNSSEEEEFRKTCSGIDLPWPMTFVSLQELTDETLCRAGAVLSVFLHTEALSALNDRLLRVRTASNCGYPVMIVAAHVHDLCEVGSWLYNSARNNLLQGSRLIAAADFQEIALNLADKMTPITEPNVIAMPTTPEVETTTYKYFYAISPELRRITVLMKEFAENNVCRVYLLGAPGAGKTTLAYYYWLTRGKGRFVAVNLTAESTDDKTAMKSLLCGHVAGSFGPHSREGALAFAEDGVCLLDESHGVTGVVMQVLMEVLDSGQFLQYGATKKRNLECAVIFASNRSWDTLRGNIHLDEYARLGTTIIQLSDLRYRREDLIAVFATTLARFAGDCRTWTPPHGITAEAWQMILACPWKGNVRTLIRVTESAAIAFCTEKSDNGLIDTRHIADALALWEPEEHPSAQIYASYN